MSENFALGGRTFRSRLIIGSGKYASFEQNLVCAEKRCVAQSLVPG